MPPVVYGLSSGHAVLAQRGLDDRRAERLGQLLELVAGAARALAGQDGDLRRRGEQLRRSLRAPRAAGSGSGA